MIVNKPCIIWNNYLYTEREKLLLLYSKTWWKWLNIELGKLWQSMLKYIAANSKRFLLLQRCTPSDTNYLGFLQYGRRFWIYAWILKDSWHNYQRQSSYRKIYITSPILRIIVNTKDRPGHVTLYWILS